MIRVRFERIEVKEGRWGNEIVKPFHSALATPNTRVTEVLLIEAETFFSKELLSISSPVRRL
jgi:hypothetical protein